MPEKIPVYTSLQLLQMLRGKRRPMKPGTVYIGPVYGAKRSDPVRWAVGRWAQPYSRYFHYKRSALKLARKLAATLERRLR